MLMRLGAVGVPINISLLCQLHMTLSGGVGGDGSADERRGASDCPSPKPCRGRLYCPSAMSTCSELSALAGSDVLPAVASSPVQFGPFGSVTTAGRTATLG